MRLASTIARLKTIGALKNNVAGAAEYARGVRAGFLTTPAAYVLPLADTPAPNPFANQIVQQEVVVRIGVVLAVQNKRDAIGAAAAEDLVDLREAVAQKLLNWAPDAQSGGFEWAAGALLDLDDQVLFWQDDFIAQTIVRSA